MADRFGYLPSSRRITDTASDHRCDHGADRLRPDHLETDKDSGPIWRRRDEAALDDNEYDFHAVSPSEDESKRFPRGEVDWDNAVHSHTSTGRVRDMLPVMVA